MASNKTRSNRGRGRGKTRGKNSPAKPLNPVQRKQVKAIVKGQGETKMAAWYSGGSNPLGIGD